MDFSGLSVVIELMVDYDFNFLWYDGNVPVYVMLWSVGNFYSYQIYLLWFELKWSHIIAIEMTRTRMCETLEHIFS